MLQFKNSEKVSAIPGLSQAVEIPFDDQKLIILSGQIPLNKQGELIGSDVKTQTTQIFKNIKAILEACGASLQDIATYAKNLHPSRRWITFFT